MRPAFRYLLDTSAVVPGLIARRVTSPRRAVLYEIVPGFGQRPAWFDNDTLVALHDARAAAMTFPKNVEHLRRAGTIELARGQYAAAREHLERAADLAPTDPDVLLPLGEALLRTGALDLAAIAYSRAEAVAPGNPQARIGRGWVSLLSGRAREAADLWRPVVSVTDNPAMLEQMLGLYRSLGDREGAAEAEAALRRLRR
jgi:Flp pilus assembly protein TadD